MLWAVAIVLLILWALGYLVFHVASALIHLLLLAAAVVLVMRLIKRGRGASI